MKKKNKKILKIKTKSYLINKSYLFKIFINLRT